MSPINTMHVPVSPMNPSFNLPSAGSAEEQKLSAAQPKLSATDLNFFYGSFQALRGISMQIYSNRVTAFIGPSGCGKSTFLRTLNRMNESVRQNRMEGKVLLDGEDIRGMEVTSLRRRVGMVFQRSNPFPKSIFDNVA